jgi:hypothetical protein
MSAKIGRNDPCPCGSGKKYKKCCMEKDEKEKVIPFPGPMRGFSEENLRRYRDAMERWDESSGPRPSFNEFMGRPNIATGTVRELQELVQGRNFASKAELEAFVETHIEAQNSAPREEFLGLSPARMRGVLSRPYREEDGIMAIREDIADGDVAGVPAVGQCRFLLEKIGASEKGIKATAKGNLPRALAVGFYDTFERADDRFAMNPMGEDDVPLLGKARFALRNLGLIKYAMGRYALTKKGRALLEHFTPAALYLDLFRFCAETMDWRSTTRYSDAMGFLQTSWVFCLYLLRQKAADWAVADDLAETYMRAFPSLVDEVGGEYAETTVRSGFIFLFLERFASYFGLVERVTGEDRLLDHDAKYRTTELFRKLFRWSV